MIVYIVCDYSPFFPLVVHILTESAPDYLENKQKME